MLWNKQRCPFCVREKINNRYFLKETKCFKQEYYDDTDSGQYRYSRASNQKQADPYVALFLSIFYDDLVLIRDHLLCQCKCLSTQRGPDPFLENMRKCGVIVHDSHISSSIWLLIIEAEKEFLDILLLQAVHRIPILKDQLHFQHRTW